MAIVSNVGGAGVLAADACADLGLTVHQPHGLTRRRLYAIVPDGGAVTGLELHPVIAGPDGVAVVNARVKVTRYEPQDPFLRRLR